MMCPFCITSAALMASSVFSAGGLTAAVMNKIRSKSQRKGAVMKLADTMLMELDQEAQTTKRVLDRVPSDKLSWKPHPKAFSLGQLALHIAAVPGGVAAAASGDTFEVPSFTQAEAKSCKEVFDTFSQSLNNAKDAVNKMDDARL